MKRALTFLTLIMLLLPPFGVMAQQTKSASRTVTVPGDYHSHRAKPDEGQIKDAAGGTLRVDTTVAEVRVGLMRVTTFVPSGDYAIEPVRVPIPNFIMRDLRGKFTRGTLPTHDVHGLQVYLLYYKPTGEPEAVINCGNWCWTDFRFSVPKPEVRIETKTEIRIEYKDREVEKVVQKCKPGSWDDVYVHGEGHGKKEAKKFRLKDLADVTHQVKEIVARETGLKAKDDLYYILVQIGACPEEKNRVRVVWFGPDGWHWKEFLIGVGVGFVGGFLVGHFTASCPTPPPTTPPGIKNPPPGRVGTALAVSGTSATGRASGAARVMGDH